MVRRKVNIRPQSKNGLGRKQFRLAVLSLAATTSSPVAARAADSFIMQPKLRQQSASEELEPATVGREQEKVALPAEQLASTAEVDTLSWNRSAPEGIVFPPSTQPASGTALRWIPRGASSGTSPSAHTAQAPAEQALEALRAASQSPASMLRTAPSGLPAAELTQPESTSPGDTRSPKAPPATLTSHSSARPAFQLPTARRDNATSPPQPQALRPVDSIPGWQSVGQRLRGHLVESEALLRRLAFYSAREEAERAMLYLAHILDGMQNRYHCEPAWAAAQQALNEADDFASEQRLSTDGQLLERLIQSHETPILKAISPDQLAPMTAAQHYRLYAEACLLEASQRHPWGSEVLYAIGRAYQAQADTQDAAAVALRWRALTFYRAATAIDPSNALAANQLGYILLQMDRPRDAQAALIASVNRQLSVPALQNLVEASYRLGDSTTGRWAEAQLSALHPAISADTGQPSFVEVDPRTFAALSPYETGPRAHHDRTAASPIAAGVAAERAGPSPRSGR
jgi:tetratricopeptide (TPR) repeat protein